MLDIAREQLLKEDRQRADRERRRRNPNPLSETPSADGRAQDGWPLVDYELNQPVSGGDRAVPVVLGDTLNAEVVRQFHDYVLYLFNRGQHPEINVLIPVRTREIVWSLATSRSPLKEKIANLK